MKFPHRRQFLHLAGGGAALPALSRIVWAQSYPSRPITIVVPFAAGGGTDVVGRIIAERLRVSLPKGTPKNVIAKLSAAVTGALVDPSVPARLADLGLETFPREQQTPEALRALQKAEIEKWWPIIKAAGIKAE